MSADKADKQAGKFLPHRFLPGQIKPYLSICTAHLSREPATERGVGECAEYLSLEEATHMAREAAARAWEESTRFLAEKYPDLYREQLISERIKAIREGK